MPWCRVRCQLHPVAWLVPLQWILYTQTKVWTAWSILKPSPIRTKHTWLVNPKFLALQVVGLWYRSLTVADLTHFRPGPGACGSLWRRSATKFACCRPRNLPYDFLLIGFLLFSIFLCLNLCSLHSQTLVAHGSSTFLHEAKPQVQMWWCQRLDAGSTVGNPTYSP